VGFVGYAEGAYVGFVGYAEGAYEGFDGLYVGAYVGFDGLYVGAFEGVYVGAGVGTYVGLVPASNMTSFCCCCCSCNFRAISICSFNGPAAWLKYSRVAAVFDLLKIWLNTGSLFLSAVVLVEKVTKQATHATIKDAMNFILVSTAWILDYTLWGKSG